MRAETHAAIATVREGLALAESRSRSVEVRAKLGRDVVTAADVAVEDLIRADLRTAFAYPVIGEERGGDIPPDASPYWLVDPICGTRNYASGNPLYCVNLALVEDGEVAVAAVGDPSRGEVVYAERDAGAWALGEGPPRRLTVRDVSRTVVVEEGKSTGREREHAGRFMSDVVLADRWDFRSLGSTLAMAYLAAGGIAAYVVFHVSAVHSAAGSRLVAEAGGVLSDLSGAPWTLQSTSLLFAARPALHAELLAIARASADR